MATYVAGDYYRCNRTDQLVFATFATFATFRVSHAWPVLSLGHPALHGPGSGQVRSCTLPYDLSSGQVRLSAKSYDLRSGRGRLVRSDLTCCLPWIIPPSSLNSRLFGKQLFRLLMRSSKNSIIKCRIMVSQLVKVLIRNFR